MIPAIQLFAEVFVFKGVFPGGVILLPTRVVLVELVGYVGV